MEGETRRLSNVMLDSISSFNEDVLPTGTSPIESRVPHEVWYLYFLSQWCDAWENVRNLWRERDCWSKCHAVVSLIFLPVRVIINTASPQRNTTIPDHTSVSYLFLLMCYTFVLNLVQLNNGGNLESEPAIRRHIYATACMVLAIVAMLYIFLFTKGRVRHDPCHDAPIRIFFRGGLYIFGFATIINSICLTVNEWHCWGKRNHGSASTVQAVKALFIITETLFLGYFHKACLPLDTALLQLCLAHLLGTNLALWFWTLCEETTDKDQTAVYSNQAAVCSKNDFNSWSAYQKYFYPVFVEYLILSLSIIYGLWTNLSEGVDTLCHFCRNCRSCLRRRRNSAHGEEENDDETTSVQQQRLPRCGIGIMIGTIYVAVFLVCMFLGIEDVDEHRHKNVTDFDTRRDFKAYSYGSIVMYSTMICACYIILASLPSPRNVQRIRSIDYDDVLLYISLMGILLLEGFHITSKIITQKTYPYLLLVDIIGTIQHLTQTVTLMSLSHLRGRSTRIHKSWICECILFLLLTNLAWWIEDSFYLTPELTRPGENKTIDGIEPYGTIVKPMVIFFRFHSATYFYNAWTIYRV